MKRKHAIIIVLIITIVAAMWCGLLAWRQYSTLRKLSQVRSDLRALGGGVMAVPVDWSLPLVPDAVFDPDAVYFRRYADRLGLDPEVMRLLNELPIDKRRGFLCRAMLA